MKTLDSENFFIFKKRVANLLFFRRHSNIFLVLLDSKYKHVVTLTSGTCKLGKTKKEKKSAHNLSNFIDYLLNYFNKFKIKYVKIIVRQKLTSHFYNLQKLLKLNNITIKSYKYLLKNPHGIIRGRKKRRI